MTNDAISLHKKLRGKIFVGSKIPSLKLSDIELIYTPGVASVSKEIFHNPDQMYALTSKGNNVAIVTDGNFDSGLLSAGEKFTLTLDKPGTYQYYCTIHPNMVGTIIVS